MQSTFYYHGREFHCLPKLRHQQRKNFSKGKRLELSPWLFALQWTRLAVGSAEVLGSTRAIFSHKAILGQRSRVQFSDKVQE